MGWKLPGGKKPGGGTQGWKLPGDKVPVTGIHLNAVVFQSGFRFTEADGNIAQYCRMSNETN